LEPIELEGRLVSPFGSEHGGRDEDGSVPPLGRLSE
jgi:hypothetical protein